MANDTMGASMMAAVQRLLHWLVSQSAPTPLLCLVATCLLLAVIRQPEAWKLLHQIFGRLHELRFLGVRMTFFEPQHESLLNRGQRSRATRIPAQEKGQADLSQPAQSTDGAPGPSGGTHS